MMGVDGEEVGMAKKIECDRCHRQEEPLGASGDLPEDWAVVMIRDAFTVASSSGRDLCKTCVNALREWLRTKPAAYGPKAED